jgi:hypothetical protein
MAIDKSKVQWDDSPQIDPSQVQWDDEPPKRPAAGALSRTRAAVAGINKGFWSDLLGLPVDTAANVLDLGKAAIGTGYQAVTGKTAPDALLPYDRSKVPGTAEWIAERFRKNGMAGAIDNPNPEDQASRILHMGGRAAGASVVPNPRAAVSLTTNAANMAKGAVGGLAAGSVGEVAPEWAGLAGMVPQLAGMAGAAGVKRFVRGGEQGRQSMAQRMQDLYEGGIAEPSAGLAAGNRTLMGVENILSQTPGSVGVFEKARTKNLEGMQARAQRVRDSASKEFGPAVAGGAMQADLKGKFKDRINETYGRLSDRFAGAVPPDQRFPISGTMGALDAATAVNPLAPQTTSSFVQPRIAGMRENILADTTVPVPGMYQNTTRNQGLPLSAIKEIRTDIGKEAASRAIFGTPEQADFKQLYGGLSQDMKNAARVTDLAAGPQPNGIGPAQTALNRANTYYSKGMTRADDLAALANNATPEGAYNSIANSLNSGGTMYSKLRNAVSPETRGKILATVIDDMGMATPGQQGADGNTWSPRTFLTNYNRIDAGGRAELFKRIQGGPQMARDLTSIAKTADMLGDSSKIWSNPSGTAPALSARATLGGLTAGAIFSPMLAAGTAGSLLAANQASRLLLNPKFVNWLAKAPKQATPAQVQAYSQRLIANANMANDPQFKQDVVDYLESVEQGE